MDPIATLTHALDALTKGIDDPSHEPDPGRADWARYRAGIATLRARYEDDVLPNVEALARELPPETAQKMRDNVAFVGCELSALVRASGDEAAAARVLRGAERVGPAGLVAEEIGGATKDPEGHAALCRARWQQRLGSFDEGDRILRAARASVKDPAIKKIVDLVLNGSRPLQGAPALFRINGFGVGIYGERDRREDGSYITTHCISALFIPIFPLGAYRVKDQGYNSYLFLSREPLSAFAKGYRWLFGASIVAAIALTAFSSWYSSPERLASVALDEVRAVEARGDEEATLRAYEDLFSAHGYSLSSTARSEAAQAYVQHLAGTVPAPIDPGQLEVIERAVARFEALPDTVREGAGEGAMLERIGAWADDLMGGSVGTSDEAHVRAALHLVERGRAMRRPWDAAGDVPLFGSPSSALGGMGGLGGGGDDPGRVALGTRATELHRALGALLASEWPLDALSEYCATGPDAAAAAAAEPVVREVIASPSLVLASRVSLETWSRAASSDQEALRAAVSESIARAVEMQGDAQRIEALASGDEAALRAVAERFPGDQECAGALADLARARGDVAGAIATLRALGSPGRMVPSALRSLAAAELDAGHLDEARAMLVRHVEPRLAELRTAQQALDNAERQTSEGLIRRLELGMGPPEIEARLRYASDDEARAIAMEYLAEQLQSDPTIAAARARYEAVAPMVPAVLQLAMIELRRAGNLSGTERDAALGDAERLFLAIQAEGASVPEYHLGLGQVYYRLGRNDQGEAELQGVLASGDDGLALAVAHTYRELGLVERARETATAVYGRGTDPHAGNAALFLSVIAERLEDVETWLSRAPNQDAPEVAVRLVEARAQRALRDGRYDEADRGFADAAQRWERIGTADEVAVNNAAVAYQQRYEATGRAAHLDEAVERFERAVRLAPDQSLTITNLAQVQEFRGELRVLARWIDLPSVRLDSTQADDVVRMLLEGPLHDEVVAALREDTSLRRSQELTRQEQVLAPRRAGAWRRAMTMLGRLADVEGLRQLDARVAQVGAIDETATRREAWERGEYDHDLTEHAALALARLDGLLERARRSRNARAIAVLQALRGSALLERHAVAPEDADVEAAIAAYREAVSSWPELGAQRALGYALVLRALASDPSARTLLESERRRFGPLFVARHAAAAGAETAARLGASADLREAATLASAMPDARLGVDEIIVAELVGDPALRARASAVRQREDMRLVWAIERRLDPSHPEAPERAELLGAQ